MFQDHQLYDVLEEKAEIRNPEPGLRDVLLRVAVEGGTIGPAHPWSPKSHHESFCRVFRIHILQDTDFTASSGDPAKFLQSGKLIFGFEHTEQECRDRGIEVIVRRFLARSSIASLRSIPLTSALSG